MKRSRHPKKDVEKALQQLEVLGWVVVERSGRGHAWGLVRCPTPDAACRGGTFCQMTVNSTPENPQNHAAKLLDKAAGCTARKGGRHDA